MIRRVGVIYQDKTSLGFLTGLRDRLGCEADFIDPPARIGKPQILPKRESKLAWDYFQKKGVDLVVRFTDADQDSWQQVKREEDRRVPDDARSIWIVAVADKNVEDWLCLDRSYLSGAIQVDMQELDSKNRVGVIKKAISARHRGGVTVSEIVADLVRQADTGCFRRWLRGSDSLLGFYKACRGAATYRECDTPNELDNPQ